jgi:hypothetical protein
MKATLLAPLSKVNDYVELCQESRPIECPATGPRWADTRPGPVAAARNLRAAWDGSDASLVFVADGLGPDSTGQPHVIGGRCERVHTGPRHDQDNFN